MTLLLVDAANILMRCAFGGDVAPERSTPMALGMIERAARDIRATHMVIALDYPGAPTWRQVEYPAYKANRTTDTSPWLIDGATAFSKQGWHCEVHTGFEADDIIATIALRRQPRSCAILSGDSDLLTLTAAGNVVLRPQAGAAFDRMSAGDVSAKYGVQPSQLLDYKAMVGETTDNLPGVPGIGAKRAAGLLQKFSDLDSIITAGAGGYSRDAELVATHAESARLVRRLVALRLDAPVPPIAPQKCALRPMA